jgi:hypothetical protein
MSKLKDLKWLFNGRHFDRDVVTLCVRWYLPYKNIPFFISTVLLFGSNDLVVRWSPLT